MEVGKTFFLFTIVFSTVFSPQEIINNHLMNEKKWIIPLCAKNHSGYSAYYLI